MPIDSYLRYAVDGNNFMGDSLEKLFSFLWKLHPDKVPNEEQR